MAKKENKQTSKKKVNFLAVFSSVIGIAGALVWSKKDLARGVMKLKKHDQKWTQIKSDPVVYLTANDEGDKERLFDHLRENQWRLADQIADGYFWINSEDEVLLLNKTEVLMGKYLTWVASRKFVDE